jgi:hypothetical protein
MPKNETYTFHNEIDPYEIYDQFGAKKTMNFVMAIEDSVNNAEWSKKLILKILSYLVDNCDSEEMEEFVKQIKKEVKIK